MTELKPCPFCGGEARIKTWGDRYGGWNARIYCINANGKSEEERCQADFFMRSTTKERVIEEITSKWNTRPNPWHTGTPIEEGLYAVYYYADSEYNYGFAEWNRDFWEEHFSFDDVGCRIIAWQKIDEYKEANDG